MAKLIRVALGPRFRGDERMMFFTLPWRGRVARPSEARMSGVG
jgi:hypothetical protein